MRKSIESFLILLLSALIITSCQQKASTPETETVSLGAVLPLTGEVASWGEDSSNGIELALSMVPANSTYDFEVVYQDSKGEAAQAVAAARKLTSVDQVAAAIGDNVSGPTVAMVPVFDSAQVPVISPSASSPKLTGMSKFFFRVYPSDTAEGSFMADVARNQLGLASVAILYVNNDFGKGLHEVFRTTFTAAGGTIVEIFNYNEDERDFRPYLSQLLSKDLDGVYLAGYYKDGGSILKQASELGVDAQFFGSTTHEDPELLSIAGRAAEGFVYPYSTGFEPGSSDPAVEEFERAFKAKFDKDPGLVAALGYDCARLLIQAVEAVGPDSVAIRNYLATVEDYQGASGKITFDENGDVQKGIRLKAVQDGSFVFLETEMKPEDAA